MFDFFSFFLLNGLSEDFYLTDLIQTELSVNGTFESVDTLTTGSYSASIVSSVQFTGNIISEVNWTISVETPALQDYAGTVYIMYNPADSKNALAIACHAAVWINPDCPIISAGRTLVLTKLYNYAGIKEGVMNLSVYTDVPVPPCIGKITYITLADYDKAVAYAELNLLPS